MQHSRLEPDITSTLSQSSNTEDAFCFAWKMCRQYETAMAAVHIGARWALALLGRAYAQKVDKIQESDLATNRTRTRNQYGKGYVHTEAITALVKLIYLAPTE